MASSNNNNQDAPQGPPPPPARKFSKDGISIASVKMINKQLCDAYGCVDEYKEWKDALAKHLDIIDVLPYYYRAGNRNDLKPVEGEVKISNIGNEIKKQEAGADHLVEDVLEGPKAQIDLSLYKPGKELFPGAWNKEKYKNVFDYFESVNIFIPFAALSLSMASAFREPEADVIDKHPEKVLWMTAQPLVNHRNVDIEEHWCTTHPLLMDKKMFHLYQTSKRALPFQTQAVNIFPYALKPLKENMKGYVPLHPMIIEHSATRIKARNRHDQDEADVEIARDSAKFCTNQVCTKLDFEDAVTMYDAISNLAFADRFNIPKIDDNNRTKLIRFVLEKTGEKWTGKYNNLSTVTDWVKLYVVLRSNYANKCKKLAAERKHSEDEIKTDVDILYSDDLLPQNFNDLYFKIRTLFQALTSARFSFSDGQKRVGGLVYCLSGFQAMNRSKFCGHKYDDFMFDDAINPLQYDIELSEITSSPVIRHASEAGPCSIHIANVNGYPVFDKHVRAAAYQHSRETADAANQAQQRSWKDCIFDITKDPVLWNLAVPSEMWCDQQDGYPKGKEALPNWIKSVNVAILNVMKNEFNSPYFIKTRMLRSTREKTKYHEPVDEQDWFLQMTTIDEGALTKISTNTLKPQAIGFPYTARLVCHFISSSVSAHSHLDLIRKVFTMTANDVKHLRFKKNILDQLDFPALVNKKAMGFADGINLIDENLKEVLSKGFFNSTKLLIQVIKEVQKDDMVVIAGTRVREIRNKNSLYFRIESVLSFDLLTLISMIGLTVPMSKEIKLLAPVYYDLIHDGLNHDKVFQFRSGDIILGAINLPMVTAVLAWLIYLRKVEVGSIVNFEAKINEDCVVDSKTKGWSEQFRLGFHNDVTKKQGLKKTIFMMLFGTTNPFVDEKGKVTPDQNSEKKKRFFEMIEEAVAGIPFKKFTNAISSLKMTDLRATRKITESKFNHFVPAKDVKDQFPTGKPDYWNESYAFLVQLQNHYLHRASVCAIQRAMIKPENADEVNLEEVDEELEASNVYDKWVPEHLSGSIQGKKDKQSGKGGESVKLSHPERLSNTMVADLGKYLDIYSDTINQMTGGENDFTTYWKKKIEKMNRHKGFEIHKEVRLQMKGYFNNDAEQPNKSKGSDKSDEEEDDDDNINFDGNADENDDDDEEEEEEANEEKEDERKPPAKKRKIDKGGRKRKPVEIASESDNEADAEELSTAKKTTGLSTRSSERRRTGLKVATAAQKDHQIDRDMTIDKDTNSLVPQANALKKEGEGEKMLSNPKQRPRQVPGLNKSIGDLQNLIDQQAKAMAKFQK